jgi:O-methyltransferase involved in polyketide biosynthesis
VTSPPGQVHTTDAPSAVSPWLPPAVDTSVAHSARVYDYWLGGKDNYAADRALAERILTAIPRQRRHVRANRDFLVRVVEYLVREAGIRQIVDIGAGLPTSPNVHEVAHAIAPDTRVVYVDNDPIVMAHARAVMPNRSGDTVSFVHGDLRHPRSILGHPDLVRMLDPQEPTGVLLLAMLMSLPAEARPGEIVEELLAPLAPGSHLAVTHTTADFDPPAMAEHVAAATAAGMRFVPRSRPEVERFFAGLEMVEPGVVPVRAWRPAALSVREARSVYIYAGVGRKP